MAGKVVLSTLNDSSGVLATQNGMTGIAKAWVNFNGTGTPAIRGAFNVGSITKNGTGDYTLNFTTAMPNANYAVNVSAPSYSTTNGTVYAQIKGAAAEGNAGLQTTTQIRVGWLSNTTFYDPNFYYVSIFSS